MGSPGEGSWQSAPLVPLRVLWGDNFHFSKIERPISREFADLAEVTLSSWHEMQVEGVFQLGGSGGGGYGFFTAAG